MDKMPQPDPNSVMKATRWILMAFFAYVLFHSLFQSAIPPKQDTANTPVIEQHGSESARAAPDCDKKRFPLFSFSPLLPQLVVTVHGTEVIKGKGEPVFCGQKVEIRYEYKDGSNKVIGKGTKQIAIGDGQLVRGAESGMIGMREGGKRTINIPAPLAYTHDADIKQLVDINSKPMTADITLVKPLSTYPSSSMPLRNLMTSMGDGTVASCGDKVSVGLTLWKTDGTKIFSSEEKPITFTLGKSDVPYGIEQPLLGTREHSEMTIIIPPEFLKSLDGRDKYKELLPGVPENEVLIAQTELLHIGEPKAKQTASPADNKEAAGAADTKDDTKEKQTQDEK